MCFLLLLLLLMQSRSENVGKREISFCVFYFRKPNIYSKTSIDNSILKFSLCYSVYM